jgi:hypothetical protein
MSVALRSSPVLAAMRRLPGTANRAEDARPFMCPSAPLSSKVCGRGFVVVIVNLTSGVRPTCAVWKSWLIQACTSARAMPTGGASCWVSMPVLLLLAMIT